MNNINKKDLYSLVADKIDIIQQGEIIYDLSFFQEEIFSNGWILLDSNHTLDKMFVDIIYN